jgi:hypothetical protein
MEGIPAIWMPTFPAGMTWIFCLAMRSSYKCQQALVIRDKHPGGSAGLYFPAFSSLSSKKRISAAIL